MKCHQLITTIILGILTSMPSIVYSMNDNDSILLSRIYNYCQNFTDNSVHGFTTNVYMKMNFNVWQRNPTLWLIPSMYSIADGDRYLVSESYNKLTFRAVNDYDSKKQVCFSTIRHNRRAMPTIMEFLTPNLYDVCLYEDHILSPFNIHNKHIYSYQVTDWNYDDHTAVVNFKPLLLHHTQLVSGRAFVDTSTGRIISATLYGEFDMIEFHTKTTQGKSGSRSLLPQHCSTDLSFKFFGNKVYSTVEAYYDCPTTLPDSLDEMFDLSMMDSIRPIPLTAQEKHVIEEYVERHKPDTTEVADTVKKFNFVKNVLQDAIGDNLISSIRYESGNTHLKLSPLLNPQYISYSSTHGLSYKIKFGGEYNLSPNRFFEFYPWLGYNFKYKKLYFTIPLYFNYDPKHNGQISVIYGNGNRISNSTVTEEIQHEHGDTLDLDGQQLDYFDDNYLTVSNNIMAFKWLEITTGFTYHHRVAYNKEVMSDFGKATVYNSFAPMLSLKLHPWTKGPTLSIDYERGIKGIIKSDIDYERWEFDASIKHYMKPMRKLNAKLGAGFYSRKKDSYFVDYMHFRDNKLPDGWDDDWSGDFQLLDSRWYNQSRYYARANLSYESPLLATSWLPLIGHYIEKERFYLNILSIDNTRPYSELGYGMTTRFVSLGLFASFLNSDFREFGCKFTFELFRRW